ncbi:hypothetical protein [Paraprevotella xylaniphila]|uniref:hypothetical protein n=1 Tax=Paraprevotella xylaniphila TaxID=454155 RepID=UPI003AB328F4
MEIKTNSTRVIYNGETTTANAKYNIEYETDGKELVRVNASVNKVEETEFPMEDGMRKGVQETNVGYIYYENGSYTMSSFPESDELPKYVSDAIQIVKQLKEGGRDE